MMRRLILVAMSCSVFGGAVGALATAATQSSASPGALAAAVQRVQDQRGDSELSGIDAQLVQLNKDFNGTPKSIIYNLESSLRQICIQTNSSGALTGKIVCPRAAPHTYYLP